MLRKNNGVVAMSNSVLNESKHRVELIKFSYPASFFLFELRLVKEHRPANKRFKMVRYHFGK